MFARLLVIFAAWWTIEKRKTKRRTMKACISVWATFDSFFFQNHVPGIMLRQFKVVMQAFRNDHYQGTRRTPTRNFVSLISFSFVKCVPCMTEHTRTRQSLNSHSTTIMWPLSVKFSIIMVNNYNLRDWRETLKKIELLNDFIIVSAVLFFPVTVNVSLSQSKHRSNPNA